MFLFRLVMIYYNDNTQLTPTTLLLRLLPLTSVYPFSIFLLIRFSPPPPPHTFFSQMYLTIHPTHLISCYIDIESFIIIIIFIIILFLFFLFFYFFYFYFFKFFFLGGGLRIAWINTIGLQLNSYFVFLLLLYYPACTLSIRMKIILTQYYWWIFCWSPTAQYYCSEFYSLALGPLRSAGGARCSHRCSLRFWWAAAKKGNC